MPCGWESAEGLLLSLNSFIMSPLIAVRFLNVDTYSLENLLLFSYFDQEENSCSPGGAVFSRPDIPGSGVRPYVTKIFFSLRSPWNHPLTPWVDSRG